MVSYVMQRNADYPAGDEEGRPASTDLVFTVTRPLAAEEGWGGTEAQRSKQ